MAIISMLVAKILIGALLVNAVSRTVSDIIKKSRTYDHLSGPLRLGYNSYAQTEEMKDVQQAIQSVKTAIAYMENNKREMEPEMYEDVVGKLANLLQVPTSKVRSMIEEGGADLDFLDRIKREQYMFDYGKAEDTKNKTADQDSEVF